MIPDTKFSKMSDTKFSTPEYRSCVLEIENGRHVVDREMGRLRFERWAGWDGKEGGIGGRDEVHEGRGWRCWHC
eukprot:SAG31_NODE_2020_length_6659_cov_1.685976_2_plen_74_part_00